MLGSLRFSADENDPDVGKLKVERDLRARVDPPEGRGPLKEQSRSASLR